MKTDKNHSSQKPHALHICICIKLFMPFQACHICAWHNWADLQTISLPVYMLIVWYALVGLMASKGFYFLKVGANAWCYSSFAAIVLGAPGFARRLLSLCVWAVMSFSFEIRGHYLSKIWCRNYFLTQHATLIVTTVFNADCLSFLVSQYLQLLIIIFSVSI